jgi:hypothetical protein
VLRCTKVGREVLAKLIDAGQEIVTRLAQDMRGSDFQLVSVASACSESRVRGLERAQRGLDAGLDDLALLAEWSRAEGGSGEAVEIAHGGGDRTQPCGVSENPLGQGGGLCHNSPTARNHVETEWCPGP